MIKFRAWNWEVYNNDVYCGMLGKFQDGITYTIKGKTSETFKTLAAAKRAMIKELEK